MAPVSGSPRDSSAGNTSRRSRIAAGILLLGLLLALAVRVANELEIGSVVRRTLAEDARNRNLSITAHYRWYLDARTIVLTLRVTDAAVPADIMRGLLETAVALQHSGGWASKVVLANEGGAIFVIAADEIRQFGLKYDYGFNGLYLSWTLPSRIRTLDGTPAFPHRGGSAMEVRANQMKDANQFALRWAGIEEALQRRRTTSL